jgi:glutamyl-tRNA synthetase
MTVVTRFAPSPTGFLHIGSARTALFNWLFARHHGGKFLLRIEDTDRERSTQEAIDAILDGMSWLGLQWDGDIIYQYARAKRHAEIAHDLVSKGKAYYCYCSVEELDAMRAKALAEGRQPRYNGLWRDRDPSDAPQGVKPVVRLRMPQTGETTLIDHVQGQVTVQNDQLDDFILLRADGNPTYMLSVVVDDHDMAISHIIRGDDHLTNSFRQKQLYDAAGWTMPELTHIPLIHGADGAKLSKRHGALGVDAYRDMGLLPEAVCNYLVRLGWSHGDDEIIPREDAVRWFSLDAIGRSPSRFDMAKLLHLNAHYLREKSPSELWIMITPALEQKLGRPTTGEDQRRFLAGHQGLVDRAKDLHELVTNTLIYCQDIPYHLEDKAKAVLTPEAKAILTQVLETLKALPQDQWTQEALETHLRAFADGVGLKFGQVAQPLRAALTGRAVSPGIFEILEVLGSQTSQDRLDYVIGAIPFAQEA